MSAQIRSPWRAPLATAAVAVLVLVFGLGRFGMWQPSELRAAEAARAQSTTAPAPSTSAGPAREPLAIRPPAQATFVRMGFGQGGASESSGRLPTAVLALFATLALAFAVGRATDPRAGAFVGIAYATMPLVFMNARQMFGGGVAQSGFTLALSAGILALYGRAPKGVRDDSDEAPGEGAKPADPSGPTAAWRFGRWVLLAALVWFAAQGAGWMLGAAPVLLGLGLAVLVRGPDEPKLRRTAGIVLASLGGLIAVLAIGSAFVPFGPSTAEPGAFVRLCGWVARTFFGLSDQYNALSGGSADMHPPATWSTYEALIEHVGHAVFPWTGIVAFGLVRLLGAPSGAGTAVAEGGETMTPSDAWREAGVRLVAVCSVSLTFALQSFHLQRYGMTAFVAAAPLAIAAGLAIRDAEREATAWRIVVAGSTFFTLIMMRDFMLFPKSSYAALGLVDGGPAFPTGFTGTVRDWIRAHGGVGAVGAFFSSNAPGEVYFLVEALLFVLIALAALFQGSGDRRVFELNRPFVWLAEVEEAYRKELDADPPKGRFPKWLTGLGLLAYLRRWLGGIALAMIVLGVGQGTLNGALTTPVKAGFLGLAALPVVVVLLVYVVLLLWNLFAVIGRPKSPLMNLIGTRVALVPVTATLIALVIAHLFVPALSEHLSPRGVWAVVRSVRQSNEPVARYGGGQTGGSTNNMYADFEPTDITSETEAVQWLLNDSPRHYMIAGSDVFPALNRAYRAARPLTEGRRNVPVIDATNSNLYVAASSAGSRGSRNPLDEVVMTNDWLTGSNDHWHQHGRYEGGRLHPEAARFNEDIEYLGYNLDSGGLSYVPVGGSFKITYHFRALRDLHSNHQVFVHVDGSCPRINGDHEPGGGRYPLRLWLNGDHIHDEQRITIPGYCRAGTYSVFIGFFQGEDRMRVNGGDHDRENRVVAARIVVR